MDIPLQGSAGANAYTRTNGIYDGVRVSSFGDVYFTWDGPGASRAAYSDSVVYVAGFFQHGQSFLGAARGRVSIIRGLFLELIHPNGQWFNVGGALYTLGTTSGAIINTTTPHNAVAGGKVTITGTASCNGNFPIASVQSSTQLTLTESPGCTGSGGSILITQSLGYYNPPLDFLRRGVRLQFVGSP